MSRKKLKRKEVSSVVTCAVFDRCNSIHFWVANFVLCQHKWEQSQAFLLQQLKWKTFLFLKLKAFLTFIYHVSVCWQPWCKWHRKVKWAICGPAYDPNARHRNAQQALLGQQREGSPGSWAKIRLTVFISSTLKPLKGSLSSLWMSGFALVLGA